MPSWRRNSIAFRLPAAVAALLLVVVGAMTVGAYVEVRRSALSVADGRLRQVTAELAGLLEASARQRFDAIRPIAADASFAAYLRAPGPATEGAARSGLAAAADRATGLRTAELWDASGARVLTAGDAGLAPMGPAASRVMLAGIDPEAGAGVGPFHLSGDTILFPVIARLEDGDGVAGYLVERWVQAGSPEGARRLGELIGADARLAVGAAGGGVWTDLAGVVPGPADRAGDGDGLLRYTRVGGAPVLARMASVPSTPWRVAVELPAGPVLAPARAFLARSLVASLILVVLGAAAAWWLGRRITEPVTRLTRAAESLAAGSPAARVEVDRKDELGRLEASFNEMALQVAEGRRELEARVARRTAALEAVNRELESFSYSVSHDLRAPLRAIDGFSRILLEDHAAELSPEARGVLDVIVRNSKQMGRLIDDLLTFSRVGRQDVSRFRVDMTTLAEEAAAEAVATEPERAIELSVERLPHAQGESALLRQVMANVIGNAVKFTRTRDPARIEVGHRREGGQVVYYVRDNGVGFDMRYAHKLFGVFQRLHRAEDFEGTGVGLAIVQRIVQRHGGRVWAESEPDRGTTLNFTLPGDVHG